MDCMSIAYHGNGKFREIGPADWESTVIWGKAFRRVCEVERAGFNAIYAVVCPLGETHHYLVREGAWEVEAAPPKRPIGGSAAS